MLRCFDSDEGKTWENVRGMCGLTGGNKNDTENGVNLGDADFFGGVMQI